MAASQGPAAEAVTAGHYIPWPALPSSSSRTASVGRGDWRSAWEETRWDAGAGRDAEELEEEIRDPPYAGRGRSGSSVVVTWCRNAVSRLPLLPSPNAHNGTRALDSRHNH
uniref:Uncharacterized protein n=1 Tax=Ananas comosus var. bracteatus TaxID=296719 RepID=A0A6V7PVN3_ANACO|nr:unnamed protein product [Ananas comosus var. bracteatus]